MAFVKTQTIDERSASAVQIGHHAATARQRTQAGMPPGDAGVRQDHVRLGVASDDEFLIDDYSLGRLAANQHARRDRGRDCLVDCRWIPEAELERHRSKADAIPGL
jgi:hypothetical protein